MLNFLKFFVLTFIILIEYKKKKKCKSFSKLEKKDFFDKQTSKFQRIEIYSKMEK